MKTLATKQNVLFLLISFFSLSQGLCKGVLNNINPNNIIFIVENSGSIIKCDSNSTRPDRIYKKDDSVIDCKIISIENNEVKYILVMDESKKIRTIKRSEVQRIDYNGKNQNSVAPNVAKEQEINSKKSDKIFKKDKSIIDCKIIEAGDKEIKYIVVTDDSKQIRTIKRKNIDRIERGDGIENTVGVVKPKEEKTIKPVKPKVTNAIGIVKPKEEKKGNNYKNPVDDGYNYSELTLGIEGSQIIAGLSPKWANEQEGLGLKGSIGGSLRYTKRYNQTIGFSAEVGFAKWSSEYRWKNDTDLLYTYSVNLSGISLSAGPKIYFKEKFYVLPKLNLEGFILSQKGYDRVSAPTTDMAQNTIYWGGSVAIGYEFTINNKFIIDASAGYNFLAKPLPLLDYAYPPNAPLHLLGFRLGFGLISYRTNN